MPLLDTPARRMILLMLLPRMQHYHSFILARMPLLFKLMRRARPAFCGSHFCHACLRALEQSRPHGAHQTSSIRYAAPYTL